MSLMDESFPYDEILESTNQLVVRNNWDKADDRRSSVDDGKSMKRKNSFKELKKFQSVNDLHAKYTMKKYKHVTSKVRKYINEMENEDKKRKKLQRLPRFNSLPANTTTRDLLLQFNNSNKNSNTSSSNSNDGDDLSSLEHLYKGHKFSIQVTSDDNNNETDKVDFDNKENSDKSNSNSQSTDNSGCSVELISKLYAEIKELRSMNEYLQTNLDNKIAQAAKLKRVKDAMEIDIVHLQDKVKHFEKRHSLPEPYLLWSQGKCSQATQTDDDNIMIVMNNLSNELDESNFDETYLLDLAGDPDLFLNCSPLKTPDLNRMKKALKIDEDSDSNKSLQNNLNQKLNKHHQHNQLNVNQSQQSSLRIRSNSNDGKILKSIEKAPNAYIASNNGSDSAIESESDNDTTNNQNTANSQSLQPFIASKKKSSNNKAKFDDNNNKNRASKKQKKIRFLKKSLWQRLLGSCGNCHKPNARAKTDDNVFYSQVNLSESTLCEADTTN